MLIVCVFIVRILFIFTISVFRLMICGFDYVELFCLGMVLPVGFAFVYCAL